ncbi:MAG: DAK2 domain-containing protein [Clostridia bacterium]|nr:DAK2 domain-containing protein [Clostridia bacterium]
MSENLTKDKMIDGKLFEALFLGGASSLHENAQVVNDLNVFPIPDGDTGENMFLTMKGGLDGLKKTDDGTISARAESVASGMLLGARGNSGVILSQLFHGLSLGLKGKATATIKEFAEAMKKGVECAYGAVAKPVEGTMLTVAREASQKAGEKITSETTTLEFFEDFLAEMRLSLERTPDLLAVLREAGVIDSGGAGLVYIGEGFIKALRGEEIKGLDVVTGSSPASLDFSKFTEDSEMVFGYCTETLVQLQRSKTDVDNFSVDFLIKYLETIGDSIVAFKTGTVVKIHVHTMTPYKVLEYCQKFGEFLTVKIENMTLQHNETSEVKERAKPNEMDKFKVKRARRKYAVVTVASGDGLTEVFKEMGADYVVSGGQTNNPSAEDFLSAFDEVNADHVFVLPNNGNIILAAKQAAEMYTDSVIHVIESKSIGQGYAALSMLDYEAGEADDLVSLLYENMEGAVTGNVAKSVRTTSLNGVEIKEGEYMGFADKVMYVSEPTRLKAACGLVGKIAGDKNYLIAVFGQDLSDSEKSGLTAFIAENYPSLEFYEIEGGQDVYDYIFICQ